MMVEIIFNKSTPDYGETEYADKLTFNIEPSTKQNVIILSNGHKKKTDSKEAKELFEKLLGLDFQKIHKEMNDNLGVDGWSLSVNIEDFSVNLGIYMWCPSIRTFEEVGWMESAKFLSYIQDFFRIAEKVGFKIRTEIIKERL